MIDIQTISVSLAALGILVAATYYTLTVRNQTRTRQAQLFMQIYSVFRTEEFQDNISEIFSWKWNDYDDFRKKYGPTTNPKAWRALGSVAGYFEGIGLMVNKKLIDISLVENLMSTHIIYFWEKINTLSIELRREFNSPQLDMWKEYLYNEIKKREAHSKKPAK
jgi:hypothetical protein